MQSLFSFSTFQSVSTLPASASPKAIDVWFFCCILRFFLLFVFHCLVEFQRRRFRSPGNHSKNKDTPPQSEHDDTEHNDKFPTKTILVRATLRDKEPSGSTSLWHQSSQVSEDGDSIMRHPPPGWHHGDSSTKVHHYLSTSQQSRRSPSFTLLDHVTPEKVNVVSLVVGVTLDVLFVLAFYGYLQILKSAVLNRFYEFDDCSVPH